ncbi:MAG: hypothetical protein KAQ98_04780 [Bacteriovoracaceae bacterium]|nr:hypothetical protein [Bacteriovoracaceae bacterium]
MTKFILNILMFAFFIQATFAGTFPEIPDGCLDEDIYCSEAKVVKKIIDGESKKVIRIKIFVLGTADDYDSEQDILDLFFDFDSWGDYAEMGDSRTIKFKKSLNLGPITWNEHETFRHYANYKIKAPFPINWMNVRAMGYYWNIEPYEGAVASCMFENQTSGVFEIPGEPTLHGGEGFKYTDGEFHIKVEGEEDEKEYYMYFTADVIPAIDFLPSIAAPYVHAGFLAILKGMFDL